MGIGKAKGGGTVGAKCRFRHAKIGQAFIIQGNVLFWCSCATSHTLGGNTLESLDTVDEMLEVGYGPHQDFKLIFLGLYFSSVSSGRVDACTSHTHRTLVRLGGHERPEFG